MQITQAFRYLESISTSHLIIYAILVVIILVITIPLASWILGIVLIAIFGIVALIGAILFILWEFITEKISRYINSDKRERLDKFRRDK